MGTIIGQDTLQELRICFNLAELERDGGVSPVVSPMLSLTEMGNTFARCQFTMPTCDVSHTVVELSDVWSLYDLLQKTGEQSCMFERRPNKSHELFVAVAALYQTLFNMTTSPPNLNNAVHIDSLVEGVQGASNIVATFDYVNMIGWKYSQGQQKAK